MSDKRRAAAIAEQARLEMEAARDALEASILKGAKGRSIYEVAGLLEAIRNGGEGGQGRSAAASLVRYLLPAFEAASRDAAIEASPDGFALVKQWRDALRLLDLDGTDPRAVADALAEPVKAQIRATNRKNAESAARDRGDLAERVAKWKANPDLYRSKAEFIRTELNAIPLSKRRIEEILKTEFGL